MKRAKRVKRVLARVLLFVAVAIVTACAPKSTASFKQAYDGPRLQEGEAAAVCMLLSKATLDGKAVHFGLFDWSCLEILPGTHTVSGIDNFLVGYKATTPATTTFTALPNFLYICTGFVVTYGHWRLRCAEKSSFGTKPTREP